MGSWTLTCIYGANHRPTQAPGLWRRKYTVQGPAPEAPPPHPERTPGAPETHPSAPPAHPERALGAPEPERTR
ncbi:hypothetical protein GCM10022420_077470 [Streptomyces iranensis]